MKLADVKRYYKSTQGIYLSDSGGRRVVDKMADLSLNRAHAEWSGTDRPEFTDFGVSKVCVERETTNLVAWSEDFTEWSNATGGRNSTKENIPSHIHDGVLGRITSTAHQGGVGLSCPVPASSNHVFSFFIQRETAEIVRCLFENGATRYGSFNQFYVNLVTGNLSEVSVGGSVKVRPYADGWMVTLDAGESRSGDPEARLEFRTIEEGDVFRIGMPQLETGAYPTNYIPTSGAPVTRLAPIVPIQNALPVTGTVGGVCDAILLDDDSVTNQYIFTNGGVFGSKTAFRFYFRPDLTNSLIFEINGSGGQITAEYPFPETDRAVFAWAITYVEGSYVALILDSQGNVHSYSRSLSDPISTSLDHSSDVYLGGDASGNQTSMRFEKPWHKDEIDRTGATDDEIKAFFEFLTLGTSMQMTADEMEIVS